MKKFASAVILLLCAELLLPYAYAPAASAQETQVETTQYCGGVTVHKISDDDRQRLWDATLGFTASEINDLARQDALANDLSFDNPMNEPAKNLGFYAQSIPVTQLSTLLGEDPRDTTVQLGMENRLVQGKVPEGLEVDIVTARAYAESRGQKSEFVDSLRELGLLPPAGSDAAVETDPVNELKITLPESGNEIALSDLYKLEAQNPESCLLDETFAGRASYAALLYDDLAYGTYSNEIASGKYVYAPTEEVNGDPDTALMSSNQHFTADDITGMLNLNGGNHLLVPSFYEDWFRFVGTINEIEFYTSLGVGLLAATDVKVAEGKIKKYERFRKAALEAQNEYGGIFRQNLNAIESNDLLELFKTITNDLDDDALALDKATVLAKKKGWIEGTAKIETIDDLTDIMEKQGLTQTGLQSYVKDFEKQGKKVSEYSEDIEKLTKTQSKFESLSNLAGKHLFNSIAFGFGWLGPARLIFQLSESIIFRAKSKASNQHILLMSNHGVMQGFKESTGMFGAGELLERIGSDSETYNPDKAFNPGKIIIINKGQSDTESRQSTTTISPRAHGWSVSTNWEGDSDTTNFEDVRNAVSDDYTSMAFKTNEILPNSLVNTRVSGEIYEYAASVGIPLILSVTIAKQLGKGFGIGAALVGLQTAMNIPEDYGKGMECSAEELDSIKGWYTGLLIAAGIVEVGATAVLPHNLLGIKTGILGENTPTLIRRFGGSKPGQSLSHLFGGSPGKFFEKFISWVSPAQVIILYYNALGTEYVTNCKDSQYKILAYKKLEGGEEPAASQSTGDQITQGIESISEALGVGSASETSYSGAATEEQLQGMSEILNFKAVMKNQVGAVQPEELYYFQIEESAWSVKGGLFDKLEEKGCVFTENYQNGDQTVSLSTDGIYVYNEDGSVRLALTDYWSKVRALSRMRSQENGLVVLPNKIIQAPLNCEGEFIEVNGAGTAEMSSGCETGKCLLEAIEDVLGRDIGDDLSSAIGTVSSVDTTEGTATFSDSDGVRFLYLGNEYEEKLKELQEAGTGPVPETTPGLIDAKRFGTEVTAPNVANAAKTTHLEVLASKLTINGDGSTEISGSGTNPTEIGEFRTLYGSRGKIEFDGSNIMVFIYSLAETSAQNIKDIEATVNDEGEIELKVDAKTGAEEVEDELNAALEKIAGEDGVQVLETEEKIYYLTDDGKLRVIDKETGEAKEYKVTGVSMDSNGNLVIDTPKGPFRFGLGMQNGQPMLSAQGPDGLNEVLALLAARGSEGMLSFNPSTGAINVYNGQDVPLSADFQKKGISFMGDENGNTYGVPANNPFTTDWSTTGTSSKRTGLTLSAWPENGWLAALMMLFVLAGVAFVRREEP
jgi:hypothetical protein